MSDDSSSTIRRTEQRPPLKRSSPHILHRQDARNNDNSTDKKDEQGNYTSTDKYGSGDESTILHQKNHCPQHPSQHHYQHHHYYHQKHSNQFKRSEILNSIITSSSVISTDDNMRMRKTIEPVKTSSISTQPCRNCLIYQQQQHMGRPKKSRAYRKPLTDAQRYTLRYGKPSISNQSYMTDNFSGYCSSIKNDYSVPSQKPANILTHKRSLFTSKRSSTEASSVITCNKIIDSSVPSNELFQRKMSLNDSNMSSRRAKISISSQHCSIINDNIPPKKSSVTTDNISHRPSLSILQHHQPHHSHCGDHPLQNTSVCCHQFRPNNEISNSKYSKSNFYLKCIRNVLNGKFFSFGMKKQNVRTFSLIICTFTYLLIGAAVFDALESQQEIQNQDRVRKSQIRITGLYNISEDDLHLLEQTALKAGFHNTGIQWRFAGAFYFSTTVITTIGYGHTTPKTVGGKLFCMAYAMAGIPLCLVMFHSVGERLNALVSWIVIQIKRQLDRPRQEVTQSELVIISGMLSIIVITSGAGAFAYYEDWHYFDCIYYCFITLTTIGFGDYVALQRESALEANPSYVTFSLIFILFGLTVVASCVNLLVLRFLTMNTEDERREEEDDEQEEAEQMAVIMSLDENDNLIERSNIDSYNGSIGKDMIFKGRPSKSESLSTINSQKVEDIRQQINDMSENIDDILKSSENLLSIKGKDRLKLLKKYKEDATSSNLLQHFDVTCKRQKYKKSSKHSRAFIDEIDSLKIIKSPAHYHLPSCPHRYSNEDNQRTANSKNMKNHQLRSSIRDVSQFAHRLYNTSTSIVLGKDQQRTNDQPSTAKQLSGMNYTTSIESSNSLSSQPQKTTLPSSIEMSKRNLAESETSNISVEIHHKNTSGTLNDVDLTALDDPIKETQFSSKKNKPQKLSTSTYLPLKQKYGAPLAAIQPSDVDVTLTDSNPASSSLKETKDSSSPPLFNIEQIDKRISQIRILNTNKNKKLQLSSKMKTTFL
ncbi:hypothetical protein SNEBB_001942 [Seison nebaliae]|nr:hypothetical protein SNEBB_001942 [Seison nebaliae]